MITMDVHLMQTVSIMMAVTHVNVSMDSVVMASLVLVGDTDKIFIENL